MSNFDDQNTSWYNPKNLILALMLIILILGAESFADLLTAIIF